MCSSTLSLTSALDVVGGERHAPFAVPPGKTPVPTVQEAGWVPGLSVNIAGIINGSYAELCTQGKIQVERDLIASNYRIRFAAHST
jgi:hypothetical protein